jgi:hypothetical protein
MPAALSSHARPLDPIPPPPQGTGVSLTIAASYQGSSASASATVNLFTQCCPSPGGAACAGTPCDSPLLKPLNITGGGQGQANATGERGGLLGFQETRSA